MNLRVEILPTKRLPLLELSYTLELLCPGPMWGCLRLPSIELIDVDFALLASWLL